MHFSNSADPPVGYSGSAGGNLKQTAREIPADGAFVLTLMGRYLERWIKVYFCLVTFTVPCKMVLTRPDERET